MKRIIVTLLAITLVALLSVAVLVGCDKDNEKNGERRRVWASCQVDGYTEIAGGHGFRGDNADRMRFKVMHKIHDFEKRFGYHMCVGCGRCDDVCPEYISYSNLVNRLGKECE